MGQRPASEASNRQAFPAAWREVRQGQKCVLSVLSVGDCKAIKSMYVFFFKLHLVDIFTVNVGISYVYIQISCMDGMGNGQKIESEQVERKEHVSP